jgi:hypothetical protein
MPIKENRDNTCEISKLAYGAGAKQAIERCLKIERTGASLCIVQHEVGGNG